MASDSSESDADDATARFSVYDTTLALSKEVFVKKQEISPSVIDIRERILNRIKPLNTTSVEIYGVDWETNEGKSGLLEPSYKLLAVLKEKLLKKKWGDVVQIVNGLAITCSPSYHIPEIVWKVGAEVLYHHHLASLVTIANHMDSSTLFHKNIDSIEILMEYSYFLFIIKDFSKALEVVKTYGKPLLAKAVDSRCTILRKTIAIWEPLCLAYIGLGLYLQWEEVIRHKGIESLENNSSDSSTLASSALLHFSKIVNVPGVWDSFIICNIVILKKYSKLRTAKEVLQNYAKTNPNNPNALVYLYEILDEFTEQDNSEKIPILLKLKELNPTHDYLEDICYDWGVIDIFDKTIFLFDLVEYEKWHNNEKIWRTLAKNLTQLKQNKQLWKNIYDQYKGVKSLSDRVSWWPEYFFTLYEFESSLGISEHLVASKYVVAIALKHKKCDFCKLTKERCENLNEILQEFAEQSF